MDAQKQEKQQEPVLNRKARRMLESQSKRASKKASKSQPSDSDQSDPLAMMEKLHQSEAAVKVIYENQKALAASHDRLDDQFTVLTRLTIAKVNEIVSALNEDADEPLVNPITYEGVNQVFHELEGFKQVPEFRDHLPAFFMGEDLTELLTQIPAPAEEHELIDTGDTVEEGEDVAADEVAQVD
jgi:hypothetical protein